MTDLATPTMMDRPAPIAAKRKSAKPARSDGEASAVSSYKLAAHLGCSRQFIDLLTSQGVIERLPGGGYNQDRARLAYIAHLKSARRSTARSEADTAFTAAKTRMMQLKIGLQEKRLMEVTEGLEWVEVLIGLFRTGLGSLPAAVAGRDLQMRRRVEQCCFDILDGLHKKAVELAEKYEAELGITIDDYPTPP